MAWHVTVKMLAQVITHQGSAAQHLAAEDKDSLPPIHPVGWALTSAPPIMHTAGDAATRHSSAAATHKPLRAPAFFDGDVPVFYPHRAPVADGGPNPEQQRTPLTATSASRALCVDDGRACLRTSFQEDARKSTDKGADDLHLSLIHISEPTRPY